MEIENSKNKSKVNPINISDNPPKVGISRKYNIDEIKTKNKALFDFIHPKMDYYCS